MVVIMHIIAVSTYFIAVSMYFIFHNDLSCSLGDLSFFITNDYDPIYAFPTRFVNHKCP
jgi:hypothetical protein